MYGKSKKIGFFLLSGSSAALVVSLVIPVNQPPVSKFTSDAAYKHNDSNLARHWCDTALYVLSSPHSI